MNCVLLWYNHAITLFWLWQYNYIISICYCSFAEESECSQVDLLEMQQAAEKKSTPIMEKFAEKCREYKVYMLKPKPFPWQPVSKQPLVHSFFIWKHPIVAATSIWLPYLLHWSTYRIFPWKHWRINYSWLLAILSA